MNQRPLGYEPNELPDCSTPRRFLRFRLNIAERTGEVKLFFSAALKSPAESSFPLLFSLFLAPHFDDLHLGNPLATDFLDDKLELFIL